VSYARQVERLIDVSTSGEVSAARDGKVAYYNASGFTVVHCRITCPVLDDAPENSRRTGPCECRVRWPPTEDSSCISRFYYTSRRDRGFPQLPLLKANLRIRSKFPREKSCPSLIIKRDCGNSLLCGVPIPPFAQGRIAIGTTSKPRLYKGTPDGIDAPKTAEPPALKKKVKCNMHCRISLKVLYLTRRAVSRLV